MHADEKKEDVHHLVNVRTELHLTSITTGHEYLEIGIRIAMNWTKESNVSELAHRAFQPIFPST
jgi:hypothetical protein